MLFSHIYIQYGCIIFTLELLYIFHYKVEPELVVTLRSTTKFTTNELQSGFVGEEGVLTFVVSSMLSPPDRKRIVTIVVLQCR